MDGIESVKISPNWPHLLAATLLLAIGSTGADAQTAAPPAEPVTNTFVKQGDGQVSSPFTKATVLKLNAIVSRSKVAIDGYDAVIAATRASVAAAGEPGAAPAARRKAKAMIAKIDKLATAAAAAHADLDKAETELKASGEVYNTTLLGGMKIFSTDVDTELHTAVTQLSARLAAK